MADQEFWPSHAYVPGRTPRHDEATFEHIRETARSGMTPEQLAKCEAFRLGLRYLQTGFYWEAHELFEPVWMVLPDPGREQKFVQCLIQIANGFLKLQMERPKAASRLVVIARELMCGRDSGTVMGVELGDIGRLIDSLSEDVQSAL